MLIDDTVCMVKLILLNTASVAIQMGQYYMDLVDSTVDGSRPHNRPDLATRDEMQCSNPLSDEPRKKFDYADIEFVGKDTRPELIPVTFGRGSPHGL